MITNYKPFIVFLFCINILTSNSFGSKICELSSVSDPTKSEINEVSNRFMAAIRKGDESSSSLLPCMDLAIKFSRKKGMGISLVKSYDLLGQYYLLKGDFDLAKKYVIYGLAVSDSIQNIKCQARLLNSLGNIESESGNVELAIEYYLKSKQAWEKKNAKSKVLGLEINIATLHLNQENYDEATLLFEKCLQKAIELKKDYLKNLCYINLGVLHENIGNFEKSLEYIEEIIKQPHDEIPQPILHKALVYGSKIHLRLKNVIKAEYYFGLAVNVNNNREKLDLHISWGDGLSSMGLNRSAISKYQIAVNFANDLNDNYLLSQIYRKISKEYRTINDYKSAWNYYELHKQINDTLRSEERRINLNKIVSKYEQQKKEMQILALEKQRKSDAIIKVVTFILIIALIILLINAYSRYMLKKNTSEKLQTQNEKLVFQNNQIKAREKLLKKKNLEIEEKNELLALHSGKIDHQNRELQRYNLDLEQFAYSVSHDLKAPIRSINSFLFLIQKNINNPEIVHEYLQIAQDNSQLLANLLDDLLIYTRLGRSEIRPVLVDLNEIFQKVVKNLDYQIHKSNSKVVIEELPVVNGFSADLYLLFQNLVHNSIKFKHPDRNPEIYISSETTPKFHIVSIRDNGVGIKNEHLNQIFKIFKRIDKELEGTGIGLAIVKKIIEYHNGEVAVESEIGQGTIFHIKLKKSLQ
ncbi:MAG: ATP-binding protein [Bacteroidia bacterium]|nr:ATP-binding protein [Bacteroidia bacterium]